MCNDSVQFQKEIRKISRPRSVHFITAGRGRQRNIQRTCTAIFFAEDGKKIYSALALLFFCSLNLGVWGAGIAQ